MNAAPLRIVWWTPPIVIGLCLALGMGIGAVTNVINVRVCPYYYMFLLGWMNWDESHVRVAAIFQGMLEGGELGLLFGIVLAVTAAASTKLRCPVSLAVGMALRVIPLALICWVLGGIIGLAWATISPELFESKLVAILSAIGFRRVEPPALRQFAWVGGSIVGGYVSAFGGSLYAAVGLHLRWKRYTRMESQGFAPIVIQVS